MANSRTWSGTVFLGGGWMVYAGPLGPTGTHRHHAVQVVCSPHGVAVLDGQGNRLEAPSMVVPADAEHSLDAAGQYGAVAYLDPLTVDLDGEAVEIETDLPGLPVGGFEEVGAAGRWAASVTSACGGRPKSRVSDLVDEAMSETRRRLPGTVRLHDLSTSLGFATSTLTHRFTAEAGIPFRRWVLWERLQLAARSVSDGANLTTAAHAAGFADSAHLNRTFRRMFGITPSSVAGIVRWEATDRPERSSR